MSRGPMQERPGIFGSETEYPILYFPDRPGDPVIPPFDIIESVVFESLLAGRKAALSSGMKGGYFLENGGQVQLEIYFRRQADTPILEFATPECRSPLAVVTYQRAFDRILEETAVRARDLLRSRGWHGRIAFGKNNRDSRGKGYGYHENYLVHEKTGRAQKCLALAAAPFLAVLYLPPAILGLLVIIAVGVGIGLEWILPRLVERIWTALDRRVAHLRERLYTLYFLILTVLRFPAILIYGAVLKATALRTFRRELMPFLATRQILTGTGRLELREGVFALSQRAEQTTTRSGIILFGMRKTIFDLKEFLFTPLALFRIAKKMSITCSDSNLSDAPALLAMGSTALLVEMIESGVRFPDLHLLDPIRALREVSRGGPWKEVAVRGPGRTESPGQLTALAIQREYLRRAAEFFADRPPGRVDHGQILALWKAGLEDLASAPGRLADRFDWAAKKALLDAAILPSGTWKEFFAWGRILACAAPGLPASCASLDELVARSSPFRRSRLLRRLREERDRGDLDPARFPEARDLHYAAQKLDLRYHEIGDEPGYQRRLEAQGLLQRLIPEEDIFHAIRHPPPDTRAHIRGYYISLAQAPEEVLANWGSVTVPGTARTIALRDPFQHQIPGEG